MDEIVCDVLVVGSGASGFATALTARHLGLDVLIAEKEPVFGGTTCFSAGVIWNPSSSPAREAKIQDSDEHALGLLRQEAGNRLKRGDRLVVFGECSKDARFPHCQYAREV